MSFEEAIECVEKTHHAMAKSLLEVINEPNPSMVTVSYHGKSFSDPWRNPLLASTGVCKDLFKVTYYDGGLLVFHSLDFKTVDASPMRDNAAF